MPVAAAIIVATVAAGTAGYQAYSASQAKDEAQNAASKAEFEAKAQADEAAKQLQDQKDRQAQIDVANAAKDRNNAIMLTESRRRIIYGGGDSYTKGGTLLTGPQGVTNPGPTNTKTLLGA